MTGFREPPTKGAMVRGTRPAAMRLLLLVKSDCISSSICRCIPLKGPVVAAMAGGAVGDRCGIVH